MNAEFRKNLAVEAIGRMSEVRPARTPARQVILAGYVRAGRTSYIFALAKNKLQHDSATPLLTYFPLQNR